MFDNGGSFVLKPFPVQEWGSHESALYEAERQRAQEEQQHLEQQLRSVPVEGVSETCWWVCFFFFLKVLALRKYFQIGHMLFFKRKADGWIFET